jgi:uncharacterized protein
MSGRLPQQIDLIRLAEEGARLTGKLPGDEFTRLREFSRPETQPAPVTVDLVFERTGQGARMMRGLIETRIETVCQRCLGPITIALVAKPVVVLLTAGEASADASGDFETLIVEGPQDLRELAEDELLLAMPMNPVHGDDGCAALAGVSKTQPVDTKPGPFTALRGLKGKN